MSKSTVTITAENPITLVMLRALKPGQRLVYYVGDLSGDIIRAGQSAPTYRQLLSDVQHTAYSLQRAGQIKLTETQVQRSVRDGSVTLTVYTAVGVADS